ncbi:ER membrane protein complex subunit 7-like [Octopus sinensis]|uniref:ER membrane protein complex subunit 7-like n=1 Tax=Octopus sinensis TaxID=2607531 RepID=A0A7E6EH37_9MOLL|nr:ER membrane protein complex subunit 7-like [Octopus sinensis]
MIFWFLCAASSAFTNTSISVKGIISNKYESSNQWLSLISITLLDGGKITHTTFPKHDSTFSFAGLTPGSYIMQVTSPTYAFDSVRLDVSPRLSIRARKLNLLQLGSVELLSHKPLKLRALSKHVFFVERPRIKPKEVIFNPMVNSNFPILVFGSIFDGNLYFFNAQVEENTRK